MNHLEVIFNSATQTPNDVSVSLAGALNSMNAINFKKDLIRILSSKNANCIVNIKALKSIDLTGLNALVMAHKNLAQKGKQLTVVCDKENAVDQFLHLTKFNRYLNIQRA